MRCPECGYEPSTEGKIIAAIIALVCFPVFLVSALVAFVSVILPFTGADLTTAAFGFVFFGVIAAVAGGILYLISLRENRTPVDPSFGS